MSGNQTQQAIALLLMLGDDFTEYEARKAFEEGGVTTSVSYLQMMGLVNQIGFRVEEVKLPGVRGFLRMSDTYRVSAKGKELLK